jgi:hypothetical protein
VVQHPELGRDQRPLRRSLGLASSR